MPTPEALVAAAQGAGARINRRRPPSSEAGSASPNSPAAAGASLTAPVINGRGGQEQEIGQAVQRRLSAFRPVTSPAGGDGGVSTDAAAGGSQDAKPLPAWQQLANAGIAGQGSRAANMAKLAETQGRTLTAPSAAARPDALANVAREISRMKPANTAPGGMGLEGGGGAPGGASGLDSVRSELAGGMPGAAGAGLPGGAAGADVLRRRLGAFRGVPGVGNDPGLAAGPGPAEANILPAITDVAQANQLPGGGMTKPSFGAPTGTAGPAPWEELAGAVTRRPRPRFSAEAGGGRNMGDLGGASY